MARRGGARLRAIVARVAARMRRVRRATELDEELALHLALLQRDLEAEGRSEAEARLEARRRLGNRTMIAEEAWDAWSLGWLDAIWFDLRIAARSLVRAPGFAAAAVLTLALGIGANVAIFSVVDGVLLRPLPFADPGRLVMVGEDNREFGWRMAEAAPANYLDWRASVPAFADAMAYGMFPVSATVLAGTAPRLVNATLVTGNFFSVLGVAPQRGRGLTDAETWDGGARVAVISDRLWRALGSDPRLVGGTLSIDGRDVGIVGVAPRGWAFPWLDVDLWMPFRWSAAARAAVSFRRAHWVRVVARLRTGADLDLARTQLRSTADRLKRRYPETNRAMDADLAPLHRFLVRDSRPTLLVLLGAVGLLLVIACANVANLLLVRAVGRQREMAIRHALGAGRGRLVRQALIESLLVSVVGGAAGAVLATWGTRAFIALGPPGLLPIGSAAVDWRVAVYVAGLSALSGLAFGIAPALRAARRRPAEALAAGGRTGSHGAPTRVWGERLAVAEIAIALALAVGGGLLVRSYERLRHVDPGFDATHVATAALSLPARRYDTDERVRAFVDEIVRSTAALPGVTRAAVATMLPLTAPSWSSTFSIDGPSAGHYGVTLLHRQVTPDYFAAMRVPLLRGRVFTAADRGSASVVVINDAFARRYFRGQDPIGQRIAFDQVPDSASVWRTIVGVVGSERQATPAAPAAIEVFAPFAQEVSRRLTVVARTTGDPAALAPALRRLVRELDPQLAVGRIAPMTEIRDEATTRDRFVTSLVSLFAAVGVILAVVGVYGVIAQLGRLRTREIGIRMALGATGAEIRWLILGRGLGLAAVGMPLGCAGALLGTRILRNLLYGVAPTDLPTYGVVAALLLAAVLAATWPPAARAARVDPATVLREE